MYCACAVRNKCVYCRMACVAAVSFPLEIYQASKGGAHLERANKLRRSREGRARRVGVGRKRMAIGQKIDEDTIGDVSRTKVCKFDDFGFELQQQFTNFFLHRMNGRFFKMTKK